MKKLLAIMMIAVLCLTGFALADGADGDENTKFHTLIENGSFIIQVDSEGDLAWIADDMAQDPSVVKLYDADTLDDTFVARYDPVGDGDVTVGVRHFRGIACDEVMTWDLHVENGAVQEVSGGSYSVTPEDEEIDPYLIGEWLENETQFAQMIIEKNPVQGWDLEIVSPVSHGAYVFKTSIRYDCDVHSFVYDKGKYWDISGDYEEGVQLGEARTAGTTGTFTFVGDDEDSILSWYDDEHPEEILTFVRNEAGTTTM